MADKRKTKRKKEVEIKSEDDKPSKLEYDVAKYLKSKLPEKKTTLLGHKVEYFIGSKAIDLLLESKWAKTTGKDKKDPVFANRDAVVDFMDDMLRHKFFHRAKTVIVKKEDKKKKKTDAEESSGNEEKEKKKIKKRDKEEEDKEEKEVKEVKEEGQNTDVDEKKVKKKKEKKRVKLDMHLEQIFVDGNEPFVWIFDHIPLKTWIIGACLVFGAIAVCLFPLWPRSVRNWVYYLSIAAAGFLFFIIGLVVLRLAVFCLVWAFTFGNHHFWLLPNLTEDVGFFESFWPLYKHDCPKGDSKDEGKKKKKKSVDESGDKSLVKIKESGEKDDEDDGVNESKESGSDSEKKSNASTNGNGDNGFEILNTNEVEEEEESKKDI